MYLPRTSHFSLVNPPPTSSFPPSAFITSATSTVSPLSESLNTTWASAEPWTSPRSPNGSASFTWTSLYAPYSPRLYGTIGRLSTALRPLAFGCTGSLSTASNSLSILSVEDPSAISSLSCAVVPSRLRALAKSAVLMYVVFMTQLMSPAEMPSPLPSTRVSSIPSPWPKKRLRLSRISRSPLSNEGFGTPPPLAFSPYGTRPRTLRPSPRFTAGSSALRCSPDCTCFALSSSRPRWPIFLATSGAKSIFALERSTGTSRSLGSPGGCGMLNAKSLSLFSVLKASMLASSAVRPGGRKGGGVGSANPSVARAVAVRATTSTRSWPWPSSAVCCSCSS